MNKNSKNNDRLRITKVTIRSLRKVELRNVGGAARMMGTLDFTICECTNICDSHSCLPPD